MGDSFGLGRGHSPFAGGGHTKGRGVKILEPEDKVVEEHSLKVEVSLT